ncbi:MAG: phospho-N-acetylmuramoyl-pentapeptide-transferase [Firmicutes bacterium HGW-Firmicutes-20]|jgi:phospho-N-acetylmuramoyl-pentapeptide-transferase|nr:MAG: phospho-N-acetylmuramoyl-pentapeptide-transferase [Firmicutes bacterium HGW-Firmicutes-20]
MELRLILIFFASLIVTWLTIPWLISFLKKLKYGQSISEYSLDEHKAKTGTPTMGGIAFVVIPVLLFLVFFFDVMDANGWLLMFSYIGYALIGFWDDVKIIIEKKNDGLPAAFKFLLQGILAFVFYYFYKDIASSSVVIPLVNWTISLGWLYAVLLFFMLVGTSNAVNLTDGMDGLAAGTSFLALIPFIYFAITQSSTSVAGFALAVLGSLLAYLRYNVYPAKIFMGDTGSLPLGALLATMAILLKQEVLLVLIGGVFVYETLCVIIQIGSVKIRKKRVFKYTPIHYSFVLSGWKEVRVVQFFWMLGFFFALLGIFIGSL